MKKTLSKKQKRTIRIVALLCVVIFTQTIWFPMIRVCLTKYAHTGSRPLSLSTYLCRVDSNCMINITGERNHIGDTQMTMAPYLLIRHWWGWEPVEMYYDVALLFDKSTNTIPRSYAFMQESSVLEKGRYTVISIGNDSLRKNGVSIENVYDSIGTKAILLSADTLGYDVQKARWFTWVYKDEGTVFIIKVNDDA